MLTGLAGETLVPLLSGEQATIRELASLDAGFFVYSVDSDRYVTAGLAVARRVGRSGSLLDVAVSGGVHVRCTPDYPFVLLDGSMRAAGDLSAFDSLLPLYRSYQTKDGYEVVRTVPGRSVVTHRMVANQFYGEQPAGTHVHHQDGNWFNNSPENLIYLDASHHNSQHAKKKGTFLTPEFKEKRIQALYESGFFQRESRKVTARKNITEYMRTRPEHFAEAVKGNGKRGAKYLQAFNEANNATEFTCDICGRKVLGKGGFTRHRNSHENHKVLYVRDAGKSGEVFGLSVEPDSAFALAAGVFVYS